MIVSGRLHGAPTLHIKEKVGLFMLRTSHSQKCIPSFPEEEASWKLQGGQEPRVDGVYN